MIKSTLCDKMKKVIVGGEGNKYFLQKTLP